MPHATRHTPHATSAQTTCAKQALTTTTSTAKCIKTMAHIRGKSEVMRKYMALWWHLQQQTAGWQRKRWHGHGGYSATGVVVCQALLYMLKLMF